jgi:hypothetical protein
MRRAINKPASSPQRRRAESFGKYLERLRSTDPLVSTFLRAARRTPVGDVDSWADVRAYLNGAGAASEVYVGARRAWREYAIAQRALDQEAARERRLRRRETLAKT